MTEEERNRVCNDTITIILDGVDEWITEMQKMDLPLTYRNLKAFIKSLREDCERKLNP